MKGLKIANRRVIKRNLKGLSFSLKNGMWNGKGLDFGAEPPVYLYKTLLSTTANTSPSPHSRANMRIAHFFSSLWKIHNWDYQTWKWYLTYKNTKRIKIRTCREIDNKRTLSALQVLYCLCSTVFRLITFFIMNKRIVTSLDYKSKKSNEY